MAQKKYKTLRIVSYDQSIDLEKEYISRFNGESSIKTNLNMSPDVRDHKSKTKFQIFFIITPGIY